MPKRSTANSATIPPPVNGWNTRDPISGMDPLYAVETINFVAKAGGVELRDGSLVDSGGMFNTSSAADNVVTVAAAPIGTTGALFPFAICGTLESAFVTIGCPFNAGPSTGVILGPGAPGNNYCWADTIPVIYKKLLFYIGDFAGTGVAIKYWNGAALLESGITIPDLTIKLVTSYKQRLYFATRVRAGATYTANLYYGGVDSIAAPPAANIYPLESLLTLGGIISYIGTISTGGDALEELFVVISDMGEVLVFSGDYPGSPTWALINRSIIPPPCGPHAYTKYSGDLLVFTINGLVSLKDSIQNNTGIKYLSENISSAFEGMSALYRYGFGTSLGWPTYVYFCAAWWPKQELIILSYPTTSSRTSATEQLVLHVPTNSWWKWTGLQVYSMAVVGDDLILGTVNGKILKMTGYYDEDPLVPAAVLTRDVKLRPAYNYFGDRSASKQFVEARPILKQSEGLTLTMDADVDYQDTTATNTVTDLTNTAYKLYAPRVGLQGIGRCASIRIDGTVTTKRFRLEATEVIWNDGDI